MHKDIKFYSIIFIFLFLFFSLIGINTALSETSCRLMSGVKKLTDDDWDPLETHDELGLEFIFAQEKLGGPEIVLGFLSSSDSAIAFDTSIELKITEINLGLRQVLHKDSAIKPFVNVGILGVQTELSLLGISLCNREYGYWMGLGSYIALRNKASEKFSCDFGLEVRYSAAQANFLGSTLDVGGLHYLASISFDW